MPTAVRPDVTWMRDFCQGHAGALEGWGNERGGWGGGEIHAYTYRAHYIHIYINIERDRERGRERERERERQCERYTYHVYLYIHRRVYRLSIT